MENTTVTTGTELQKRAHNIVFNWLDTKKRSDDVEFIYLKDEAPTWMHDMVHDCHVDTLPDDYKYKFIQEALLAIVNHSDPYDARDSLSADIYTSDLTSWLASNNLRHSYVDDAIAENGDLETCLQAIGAGQVLEKQEVFDIVLSAIQK